MLIENPKSLQNSSRIKKILETQKNLQIFKKKISQNPAIFLFKKFQVNLQTSKEPRFFTGFKTDNRFIFKTNMQTFSDSWKWLFT